MPLPEFLAGESRKGEGQGDQPGDRDPPPQPPPKDTFSGWLISRTHAYRVRRSGSGFPESSPGRQTPVHWGRRCFNYRVPIPGPFQGWLCKGTLLPGVRPGLWWNLGLWGKPPIHQKTPLLQLIINSLKGCAPADLSAPIVMVPEVFPNSLLSLEDWRYGVCGRGFVRLLDRKFSTS